MVRNNAAEVSISEILNILERHDIRHDVEDPKADLPEVGEIFDGESIYSTSLNDVLSKDDDTWPPDGPHSIDDERVRDWLEGIERIIREIERNGPWNATPPNHKPITRPACICAWYCPIHYFGHDWGIYIRESCILSLAKEIAWLVDWKSVPRRNKAADDLLRTAFYILFLHEQFHHKVESLGFRFLVSSGKDAYRPYKANVYRPTFLTKNCLEESLAEADSFRRLDEPRYKERVSPQVRKAARAFLRFTIPLGSPGYAQGANFLSDAANRKGLNLLQTQVREGQVSPIGAIDDWLAAPGMSRGLMSIDREIYVVLPKHSKPIFRPSVLDPRLTVSTKDLITALIKHYGYTIVPGGKGSHMKLKRQGAPTIILPGNRSALSPGVIKQALDAIGGKSISQLSEMLSGQL